MKQEMNKRSVIVGVFKALVIIAFLADWTAVYSAENTAELRDISELKYGKNLLTVGEVSVAYTEVIKLMPDTAEFSIVYLTEGATLNAASNQNIKNSDEFKKYLKSLGIKEGDITTVRYENYERTIYDEANTKPALYKTTLMISLDIDKNRFYDIIKLLEKNGVTNLRKDDLESFYYFTITGESATQEAGRRDVQERFLKIEKVLKNNGISELDILKYDTDKIEREQAKVKKYFVLNTLHIKTAKFANIGKIYSRAQELKMNVVNDLIYTVSEDTKNSAISDHEGTLLEKLHAKAQRIVGGQYSVGVPSKISVYTDAERDTPSPYYGSGDLVSNIVQSQVQPQSAESVSINPPLEYTFTVSIQGSFEIVARVK